jgi:multisubunit Na+/H+ antiporter MnhC subunit
MWRITLIWLPFWIALNCLVAKDNQTEKAENSDEVVDQDRSDNLDVVLTFIKERATAQSAQITSLDGKANFGLAAASLLIAGVSNLQSAFTNAQRIEPAKPAPVPLLSPLDPQSILPFAFVLTALAFATYMLVVFSAYQAYKVRGYTTVPNPEVLLREYWVSSAFDTKAALASTLASAIDRNEPEIARKAGWVRFVTLCLFGRSGIARGPAIPPGEPLAGCGTMAD